MTVQELWNRTTSSALETIESRMGVLVDLVKSFGDSARHSGPEPYLLSEVVLSLRTGFALASQNSSNSTGVTEQIRAQLEGLSRELRSMLRPCQSDAAALADMELNSISAWYSSENWIPAVQDGVPHELWFALRRRDLAEANMKSRELIGIEAAPASAPVGAIERTDQRLRAIGSELWEKDPADSNDAELRLALHPRDHWWWWLDVR